MAVNITGTSFDDLAKAIGKVNRAASKAWTNIDKIFNLDYTGSKLETSMNSLNSKLIFLNVRAQSLKDTLKEIKKLNISPGSIPGGSGKGGSPAGSKPPKSAWQGPFSFLFGMQSRAYKERLVLDELFGFKSNFGLDPNSSGNPLMVSRFGNPGQMPLMSRFRVFQRPFPGSERNPFALGDAANILNNVVFSAGRSLEGMFKTLTFAGTDSVRLLSGLGQVGLSVATSLGSMVPVVGTFITALGQTMMHALEIATKTLTYFVESLGKAIGGLINFATNLALGVSGLAARAVQAASSLTELKNAAAIYVGREGGAGLYGAAMEAQGKYGLSATDSLRLMTRIAGQVRQTTGAGEIQASKDAIDVFRAASEAGSVLNMSIDDIGKTLQSALAGRYTPLRRIGVAVSAPYLDQIAALKGYTATAKTPFEARMKALLDEIKRQTSPFLGDLAATQYEFANQQRKLLGMFEGMFVQAGRILEPFAKVLLIISNDVLGRLYEKLSFFADGVDAAVKATVGGGGGSFGQALRGFAVAVARAADYVIHFGSKLWESRDAIGQALQRMFNSVSSAIVSLVQFAAKMVATLANLVGTFDGLIPSVESFGRNLVTLADFIDRHFGEDRRGKAVAQFANDAKDRDVLKHMEATNSRGGLMRILSGGGYSQDSINAVRERVKESESRFNAASKLMGKGVNQNEAIYEAYGVNSFRGVGKNGIETIKNVAGNLEMAASRLEKGTLEMQSLFGEVPKVVMADPVLQKLISEIRTPVFVPPDELVKESDTGKMATYFSPAAFRDEVQNRSLSAAEETAQNTAEMAAYLKMLSGTKSANDILSGGKTAFLGA